MIGASRTGSGGRISAAVGGTLYQGLVVHADGRFVAGLEMGGGVVRALRMARSDAAGEAGWRDLTGKLVFPGPVVLWRFGVPQAGSGGLPATTVGVPAPIPLLRGVEPELEALPEAVFGHGCAAFAVDDRIRAEPGWDGDLVRVTGHCGATLVVLSDDARVMKRSAAGRMPPLGRAAGSAPPPCASRCDAAGFAGVVLDDRGYRGCRHSGQSRLR